MPQMPINPDGTVDESDLGPQSGFEDFLRNLADAGSNQPSPKEENEETDEQPHEQPDPKHEDPDRASEGDEETDGTEKDPETSDEEDEGEGKEPTKKYADEGVYTKIKVGDEEHEVPLKDLTRLYGQEAALTQRSQKLADERKAVESQVERNKVVTDALLQRAMERFEPYSKVDFNLAAQKLTPEEYTALRNEAQAAHQDVVFLKEQADHFADYIRSQNLATLRERASATLKELADPEKGIKGWNEEMYNGMANFATSKYGVPKDVMDTLVDTWAFKIIADAMAFHKANDVNANVKVTKVNKTPKKIVKGTTPPAPARAQNGQKALKKLQATGSVDDATEAFLENLADRD